MMGTLTPRSSSAIAIAAAPVPPKRNASRLRGLPQVYLHPGQMHASAEPCMLTTILGSCVAVCLYDARLKVGGMNHFLLPNECKDGADAGRYGPSATQMLLEKLFALGATPNTMTARLVGGANVLSALVNSPLGIRNVEVAQEVLDAAGVRVTVRDVGGERGRKLAFAPRDGLVSVQLLGR